MGRGWKEAMQLEDHGRRRQDAEHTQDKEALRMIVLGRARDTLSGEKLGLMVKCMWENNKETSVLLFP